MDYPNKSGNDGAGCDVEIARVTDGFAWLGITEKRHYNEKLSSPSVIARLVLAIHGAESWVVGEFCVYAGRKNLTGPISPNAKIAPWIPRTRLGMTWEGCLGMTE